ncbi:MAG: phosphoglucomutase/phosphomannomutase family protein [Chloroflexota bacterium]
MGSAITFGTDGWRGIIAEDFTFQNVRFCAQGVADYLRETGLHHQGLVVGYDTRFASEDFAAATAEVVAANGIRVHLCGEAAPIPVISYAIQNLGAGAGVIITASHNPGAWNGFKYRLAEATAAPPQTLVQLEQHIARTQTAGRTALLSLSQALQDGMVEMFDPRPAYLQHIAHLVDLPSLRQSGLNLIADPMYGAGMGYFKAILGGDSAQVVEIHGERNPLFPGVRPEPIGPNLGDLCARVAESGARVGLATDGDADRVGIVDEKGTYLTTLQVFALLALYLLESRGLRGPIIRTITSSAMLDRLGELYSVPVHQTPVGFKYVAPKMSAEEALIGGEESGGYAFRGHILERDGIVSGLFFLDLMVKTQKTPSQLVEYLYSKVGSHHYDRVDIEFAPERRQEMVDRLSATRPGSIENVAVVDVQTGDGFRYILSDSSWLLIRFSGTEPLLRIYAESDSPQRVQALLTEGKKMAGV